MTEVLPSPTLKSLSSTYFVPSGRLMSPVGGSTMLTSPYSPPTTGGVPGLKTTEAVVMASVGADSHLLSSPQTNGRSYRLVGLPTDTRPPPPSTNINTAANAYAAATMPNGRRHISNGTQSTAVLDTMNKLNAHQNSTLTLQTVDTPTGQCFLLTNDSAGVVMPTAPGLGGQRLQSATFIPFDRITGVQGSSLQPRVTVLPAFQRSNSNESSTASNDSSTNQHKDKRRASHNEVEKRRRDKINQWIDRLRHFLPGTDDDDYSSKTNCSKGIILAKTVEFIEQLKKTNQQLTAALSDPNIPIVPQNVEQLSRENQLLRKHLDDLKLPLPPGVATVAPYPTKRRLSSTVEDTPPKVSRPSESE